MDYELKILNDEGLSKELQFRIEAKSILESADSKINEEAKNFKMAGFREGKVPINMVRKRIGADVLSKEIESVVDKCLRKYFEENKFKPAAQPQVEIKEFDDKSNLIFVAKIEVFSDIPSVDWAKVEVETLAIEISDEDVKKAHNDILKNFKNFDEAEDSYEAENGDATVVDFVGKIDGEEFDGGKGEDIRIEIGSKQFIPGFEEQLIGVKAHDKKEIIVKFPGDYNIETLADKEAVFNVHVKKVLTPETVENIDEEFAKKMGLEGLDQLNDLIKLKIKGDFDGIARLRTKKLLFDIIDSQYKFDVPPSMFKLDFEIMWAEIEKEFKKNPDNFKGKTIDQLKSEYQEIAARRVRLGILLADTAREAGIEIKDEDLQQAVFAEAMQRPGQEKLVMDFYKNKENLERLKGPVLEEKAVDYILTKVKTSEVKVTSKEFFDKYANELGVANQG